MSKVLSSTILVKILSNRLLIHSRHNAYTMDTLWGISLQSHVEPFFELYESLVLSKDHRE